MQTPVVNAEVAARLHAIIRRSEKIPRHELSCRGISLNRASLTVWRQGQRLMLTHKEVAILEVFLTHHVRVITQAFLKQNLHRWQNDTRSNIIEAHIYNLRKS
ncbi:winged helix-turn-helix domain-containing protein [Enterobacter asburiae]|uniref:winged helix-turn-helix domain-containing protein n=1 Tax=Enterobacter asburiae TaxID=61645 RepID=UPI003F41F01E